MDEARQTQRLSSSSALVRIWPLAPPILADEILSSWLIRAGLRHSCNALTLTGDLWPGWRYWCTDPDIYLDEPRLRRLSERSGVPTQAIRATLLCSDVDRIRGGPPTLPVSYPWILCLGGRNRRRAGGLQYCPQCFAEGPAYFRRQSRFAWHTVCASHQILLQDQCPHCASPLCPHLLEPPSRGLSRCHRCCGLLSAVERREGERSAALFQTSADLVLSSGVGQFGSEQVSISEWFFLSRWITGFLRRAVVFRTSHSHAFLRELGVDPSDMLPPKSGLPFDLLPPQERAVLLSACWQVLLAGPDRIGAALVESQAPPSMFSLPSGGMPICVNRLMQLLSVRRCRALRERVIVKPRSPSSVLKMWYRLQRKMQR